jgi:hypothetical protein
LSHVLMQETAGRAGATDRAAAEACTHR